MSGEDARRSLVHSEVYFSGSIRRGSVSPW